MGGQQDYSTPGSMMAIEFGEPLELCQREQSMSVCEPSECRLA
jgi:hypothetical protein